MKNIFTFAFIMFAGFVHAQNTAVDSLIKVLEKQKEDTDKVNTLNELSNRLTFGDSSDYVKAQAYLQQSFALAENLHFKNGIAQATKLSGMMLYYWKADYAGAAEKLLTAIKIFEETGYKEKLADCYAFLGDTYSFYNIPESLKSLYKALNIYETLGLKKKAAQILSAIAMTYADRENFTEAIKYCNREIEVYKEIDSKSGLALSYTDLGDIYFNQANYDEALKMHQQALAMIRETGDSATNVNIFMAYLGIGNAYEQLGEVSLAAGNKKTADEQFAEALKNYFVIQKVFTNIKQPTNQWWIAHTSIPVAEIYTQSKQYQLARKYLQTGLQLSLGFKEYPMLRDAYKNLAGIDSAEGNFQKAFEDYKLYIAYRDSVNNDATDKKFQYEKMQYEFDKKQDSVKAVIEKREAMTAAELKNQKLIRNVSIAGATAFVGLSSFSFYRYRRRKKLQSEKEMLNERLRISRELHDDIGSTLGSISIYSEVAKNRSEKNENANEAIVKIGNASRELIEKMSDIVWSINPNNEGFGQLQNRVDAFAAMLLTPGNIHYNIITDEDVKHIQFSAEEIKNIYLIFKETLHNIVKHAACKKVMIRFSKHKDVFDMVIADDGKGFKSTTQNDGTLGGNGLKNMQKRAEQMNAVLKIVSSPEDGTKIQLSLEI
ncbi:tetratricopeptide repeat protein [Panacibacter ginsenosidivorans]|uniref:histidine kinase n=1 Tax=Panacibacter ginsenosidivorans TaxID=1813871 RepID=A0A5B8V541_9BACT|nr:tetratricopeptide repeat-containing sensor histidine kinase [Panacibacter ginsenosidivorans]QEC66617.1 tetratricopeptide repeat protein [Panacibacter ginsenosidivorans]